jgi:hypothetical protein
MPSARTFRSAGTSSFDVRTERWTLLLCRYRNHRLPAIPLPLYPELKLVPPIISGVDERLAEFMPDLVHVVNPFLLGVVGIQAGRAVNVPVVASYHTDLPGYTERWGMGFSKGAVLDLHSLGA